MDNYKCTICGYVYKPSRGDTFANIPPGVPFDELPEDYKCPMCSQPKVVFEKIEMPK